MKLVVGLGNPGKKYINNRHNVGFIIIDALASKMVNGQWSMVKKHQSLVISHQPSEILAKPTIMMNSSGETVNSLASYYKIQAPNIWIIHDDLDIKLGQYKIQIGKGPKVHKGLLSIYERLGRSDFWHVRVGVENRKKKFSVFGFQYPKRIPGEKYVLQDFMDEELEILKSVIDKIVAELSTR